MLTEDGMSRSSAIYLLGMIYSWGCNDSGQLGNGTYTSSTTPVPVKNLKNIVKISCGAFHVLALDHLGRVYGWGSGGYSQLGKQEWEPNADFHSRPTPVRIGGPIYTEFVGDILSYNDMTAVKTFSGDIYLCGVDSSVDTQLVQLWESWLGVCRIETLTKMKYSSLEEMFLRYTKATPRMISIGDESYRYIFLRLKEKRFTDVEFV